MTDYSYHSRIHHQRLLSDRYRPGYHFAGIDSCGYPGDPNGAFFADGRYHLMYLYQREPDKCNCWGHLSSVDLLHWRSHPDALSDHNNDRGCISGGAFVDDDGTAYISYWKLPHNEGKSNNAGVGIAYSKPPYDKWERIMPLAINARADNVGCADTVVNGRTIHIACADPSNIWKAGGHYYMQCGNKLTMDQFGANDADYRGNWTDLFRSENLREWKYVHRFYTDPGNLSDWPDETEDDMCPTLLPLFDAKSGGVFSGKMLQSFISYTRGAQYFIGELKNETFFPEKHGRFTCSDMMCSAPEAMIDGKNRQLIWHWIYDDLCETDYANNGWSGVFSFPRVLWYDDELRMAPAEELSRLQFNMQQFCLGTVNDIKSIAVKNGESFRIKADIVPGNATYAGFIVRSDSNEFTKITVDLINKQLVFDAVNSGKKGSRICEQLPFELSGGEKLRLDVFADKSVIEVYANERQAICRRVFPSCPDKAVNVAAVSDGALFESVVAYEMAPTNLY